jgi:zinc transport system ATP-binding protein
MLGLLKPQTGTVRVLGRSPTKVRHRIGYVPQDDMIDRSAPATVLDVVLTGRLNRSSWGFRFGSSDKDAAMAALEQTEAAAFAARPLSTLSGGQCQRVLIARALAAEARLLLMDEPIAGVDRLAERGLIDLLHRLNDTMPIVMVSHDVSFVSRHLKRVACLNRRLSCHAASEITDESIAEMYHGDMRMVHHEESCPLTDPGCEHGCETDGGGAD